MTTALTQAVSGAHTTISEDFNEWVKDPDSHDDEARKYCRDQTGILTLVNSAEKTFTKLLLKMYESNKYTNNVT